ncbi:MAG: metalloregulator ArsR/SmtB family transcription factor [Candidatus Bathyarchaeota archaeon]|nr:metalloregulator ArsR/SmtB family transcription factor [Candidatus Bathyarchaeota archaeon]
MKQTLSDTCRMFFSTLSNPTRLAILELLRDKAKNVTEIAKVLNEEQSMISHNLRPLEKCGFVFLERRKGGHFYSLNKETMEPLFKIFAQHAQKYCDTKGKCVTVKHLKKRGREEASKSLYLSRH